MRKSLTARAIVLTVAAVSLVDSVPRNLHAQGSPTPLAAWVELGPAGKVIARSVTVDSKCPEIVFDSSTQLMQVRLPASPPAYPVTVCETAIPGDVGSASIAGRPLPLPKANSRRIVVVGDGGCRVVGEKAQACNDPQAWPFLQLAESAAQWQPDLVIHVGDYLYREGPCPAGNAGCAGSPSGYTWATMNADLFSPASSLLRAAPWVFVRGNHESCNRNGDAWFRLLDPRPVPASCQDYTDPYPVQVGDLQLLVLDGSNANDFEAAPDQVAIYATQFAALRQMARGNAWLLTHRPMWIFGHAGEKDGVEQLFRDNPTLQAASQNSLPAEVQLVLSGHIHLFELLGFTGDRPPQVCVGNSGTLLDHSIRYPLSGLQIAGATVALGKVIDQFGFLTLERSGEDWVVTARDVKGVPSSKCLLRGRVVNCESPQAPR